MFLRTFTGPRRPAVISFYSPLIRNVANSLLATVTGHAGRCFFCDVGPHLWMSGPHATLMESVSVRFGMRVLVEIIFCGFFL